jgi:hypothetical protein
MKADKCSLTLAISNSPRTLAIVVSEERSDEGEIRLEGGAE